jgi:hypothetical protein
MAKIVRMQGKVVGRSAKVGGLRKNVPQDFAKAEDFHRQYFSLSSSFNAAITQQQHVAASFLL